MFKYNNKLSIWMRKEEETSMKSYLLLALFVFVVALLVVFGINSRSETQRSMASSGSGGGVSCQVICNGQCPQAPFGYTLTEAKGQSGSVAISGGAAGRCFSGQGLDDVGTETMCCYFPVS